MPTTIQIQEPTLKMLKEVKSETNSASYDEAITKLVMGRIKPPAFAGILGSRIKQVKREVALQGIRDKHDRF